MARFRQYPKLWIALGFFATLAWTHAAPSTIDADHCLRPYLPLIDVAQPKVPTVFSDNQKLFLGLKLFPLLAKRTRLGIPEMTRPCAGIVACVELNPLVGGKRLRIEWDDRLRHPEIVNKADSRTLRLPKDMDHSQLPSEGDDMLHHFLMGHPLHPYIAPPDATLVLKPSQKQAIQAASGAIDRGDRSFLFVAPTGLGKTEVLLAAFDKQLKRKDLPKLQILIVDQVQLGSQLSQSVDSLQNRARFKLIQWGGEQKSTPIAELIANAEKSNEPTVLVTTIQSLKARVLAEDDPTLEESNKALVRKHLGTLMFDEVHHAGATQARDLIRDLIYHQDSRAFFYGTTATPMHSEVQLIESLFGNRAFWAGLDTADSYLAHSGSIDRSIEEIVDQLALSLRKGELAPLEDVQFLDPENFVRGDARFFVRAEQGEKARYRINPEYYADLLTSLKPSFKKHPQGFVTVSSIEEAQTMRDLFNSQIPGKRFASLHSQMPKEDQAKILSQFKRGEIDYLVTVKKLDEGVNIPAMSLYVDLNRSVGPRQILQRLGRVLRLNPGKEGSEVITLFEADEHQIREKLVLLERILRGDFDDVWRDKKRDSTPLTQRHREALTQLKEKLLKQKKQYDQQPKSHPVRSGEDLVEFFETHQRIPSRTNPQERELYQRMHQNKQNPEFLDILEEYPELWSQVVDLGPRKSRSTLGANGPEASADFLNQFVAEVTRTEGQPRLPDPKRSGLTAEQAEYEGALLRRIQSYADHPELREKASPELNGLLDVYSQAAAEKALKKFANKAARAEKPAAKPRQAPAIVQEAAPQPEPPVRIRTEAEEKLMAEARLRNAKRIQKNEQKAQTRAQAEQRTQAEATQRMEQTNAALSLTRKRGELSRAETRKLEQARDYLRKHNRPEEAAELDRRIGAEFERRRTQREVAATYALTPEENRIVTQNLRLNPRVEEDFKQHPPVFREFLRKKVFVKIANDPTRAGVLNDWGNSGSKSWSTKVNYRSVEYRILYMIRGGTAEVLMIGNPAEIQRYFKPRLDQYLKTAP